MVYSGSDYLVYLQNAGFRQNYLSQLEIGFLIEVPNCPVFLYFSLIIDH